MSNNNKQKNQTIKRGSKKEKRKMIREKVKKSDGRPKKSSRKPSVKTKSGEERIPGLRQNPAQIIAVSYIYWLR